MKTAISIIACVCWLQLANAQYADFRKDSLQIKVITTISYKTSQAIEIKVQKIYCNYCNEAQLALVKAEAQQKTYEVRNSQQYVIRKGVARLSLYMRYSKEAFRKLKQ